jgi:hypothetical protein
MICQKHDLEITGCSRQTAIFQIEVCEECPVFKESQQSFGLKIIAPRGVKRFGKPKAICSVCKDSVYDNVDPKKIITCGRCVQKLLSLSRESKIALRERSLAEGDREAARSIESFIIPEEDNNEPTQKLRRTVERKRPLREIRATHGKKPFRHRGLLDQRGP